MNAPFSAPLEATRFGSGHSVARMEDDALLRGQGQFTDDLRAAVPEVPEAALAHLVFVRSPHAHARIVSIDASAAQAMPGVLLVLTGQDMVQAGCKPMAGAAGFTRAGGAALAAPARRPLAHERVRFVGEPVVAVVAQTREQARDAAEAVQIDYEELPAVTELPAALGKRLCATQPPTTSRPRRDMARRKRQTRHLRRRPTWCAWRSRTSAWWP